MADGEQTTQDTQNTQSTYNESETYSAFGRRWGPTQPEGFRVADLSRRVNENRRRAREAIANATGGGTGVITEESATALDTRARQARERNGLRESHAFDVTKTGSVDARGNVLRVDGRVVGAVIGAPSPAVPRDVVDDMSDAELEAEAERRGVAATVRADPVYASNKRAALVASLTAGDMSAAKRRGIIAGEGGENVTEGMRMAAGMESEEGQKRRDRAARGQEGASQAEPGAGGESGREPTSKGSGEPQNARAGTSSAASGGTGGTGGMGGGSAAKRAR